MEEEIHGDLDFLDLKSSELKGLKFAIRDMVAERIGEFVPDVIVAHRYKPFFVAQLLNAKLDVGAVMGVMHEYGFLGRSTRSLYSRFWKDNVHLIGVSEPVCREVREKHAHLTDRIHHVPHAIKAPVLHDSVSARHELGLPLGAYCYGTIGRLVKKKNQRLLIEAHAQLNDDSILALVGTGELRDELAAVAKSLGSADRVHFCGYHHEARRLLKAFDAFVLPSTIGGGIWHRFAGSNGSVCADSLIRRARSGECCRRNRAAVFLRRC